MKYESMNYHCGCSAILQEIPATGLGNCSSDEWHCPDCGALYRDAPRNLMCVEDGAQAALDAKGHTSRIPGYLGMFPQIRLNE